MTTFIIQLAYAYLLAPLSPISILLLPFSFSFSILLLSNAFSIFSISNTNYSIKLVSTLRSLPRDTNQHHFHIRHVDDILGNPYTMHYSLVYPGTYRFLPS